MLISEQMARKQHRLKPFFPSPTPRAETMPLLPPGLARPASSRRALTSPGPVLLGGWEYQGPHCLAPERDGTMAPAAHWMPRAGLNLLALRPLPAGRADINHLPREGTKAPSGTICGSFSSGEPDRGLRLAQLFSLGILELAIVWLLMNFSAIRKPKGGGQA